MSLLAMPWRLFLSKTTEEITSVCFDEKSDDFFLLLQEEKRKREKQNDGTQCA